MTASISTIQDDCASDELVSIQRFDIGNRVLFLPYEPGIYVGLILPSIDIEALLSDTQSVSSLTSNTNAKLARSKTDATVFLDLASMPAKIQLILTKFEMIVIGKVTSIRTQEEEETKDIGELLSIRSGEIESQILPP